MLKHILIVIVMFIHLSFYFFIRRTTGEVGNVLAIVAYWGEAIWQVSTMNFAISFNAAWRTEVI